MAHVHTLQALSGSAAGRRDANHMKEGRHWGRLPLLSAHVGMRVALVTRVRLRVFVEGRIKAVHIGPRDSPKTS